MIRTLVIDDEQPARERLKQLLDAHADVDVVGEADDGVQAAEKIAELAPDLVLLDIQMPGASGLDVAASLGKPRPAVIFCTAFDQYAVDAFELSALDYLLKPVNRARLAAALDRVRAATAPTTRDRAIEQLTQAAGMAPARFLARRGNRFRVVPAGDVVAFTFAVSMRRISSRCRETRLSSSMRSRKPGRSVTGPAKSCWQTARR
jgi:DNA-binding LytR/AlgR family response regulator